MTAISRAERVRRALVQERSDLPIAAEAWLIANHCRPHLNVYLANWVEQVIAARARRKRGGRRG
jgi:hypothetical protein